MIGIIYFIKCNKNSKLLYIGSTIKTIKERYKFHYYNYKNRKYTFSLTKYFNKYGIRTFYIEKYKEYKIIDKKHLLAYEQLAINKFKNKIVNKNNPFGLLKLKPKNYNKINRKKYYEKNKDKLTYKKRIYYRTHKEKYKQQYYNNLEYYKNYRVKNKKNINAYSAEYRVKNAVYFKNYRVKNADILKKKSKLYYLKNKEKRKANYNYIYNKEKLKQYYLKKKEENKDKYKCECCNYATHNKQIFNNHLESKKHIKNTDSKVEIKDNYYLKNKEIMNITSKNYYNNNKEKLKQYYLKKKEENKDKYKCDYCNYVTHSNSYFNTHLKSKKHIKNSNANK